MSEVPIFKTRHGFKKVVVTANELILERSLGPVAFGRRRYLLDSIKSVHFHSKTGHAADQFGSIQVQVSGFTLTLKDGGCDG